MRCPSTPPLVSSRLVRRTPKPMPPPPFGFSSGTALLMPRSRSAGSDETAGPMPQWLCMRPAMSVAECRSPETPEELSPP